MQRVEREVRKGDTKTLLRTTITGTDIPDDPDDEDNAVSAAARRIDGEATGGNSSGDEGLPRQTTVKTDILNEEEEEDSLSTELAQATLGSLLLNAAEVEGATPTTRGNTEDDETVALKELAEQPEDRAREEAAEERNKKDIPVDNDRIVDREALGRRMGLMSVSNLENRMLSCSPAAAESVMIDRDGDK